MSAALLIAAAMLLLGVRLRPRPAARSVATMATSLEPLFPTPARASTAPNRTPWRTRLRRRRSIDPGELAGWCDALARAVRGGDTLHHALRATDPPDCVAAALAPVVLALDRGASVSAAIDEVDSNSPYLDSSHLDSSHLDLVVVVLRACAGTGGASAEPIDRAAAALRQRAALSAERATPSAQARLSAIVMTLLPGAMLLVLLATSGAVRAASFSPIGVVVLAGGAGLNLSGWAWMRRIIGGSS